jgi:hypothetical protein
MSRAAEALGYARRGGAANDTVEWRFNVRSRSIRVVALARSLIRHV